MQKHVHLFCNELNKFNNNIKMFILFENEIDLFELKQTLYYFFKRDRKTINDVL